MKKLCLVLLPLGLPVFILSLFTLLTPTTYALTCTVPGDHATIQAAVNDFSCDSVEVGAGTFNENISITRAIIINGSGIGSTTIDGGGLDSVFDISAAIDVHLQNMTIMNGAGDFGGGVKIVDSTVTIDSVHIQRNVANQSGGGIYNNDGTLYVYNSEISSNEAEIVNGGGIYQAFALASTTVSNTTILENRSPFDGGGIYSSGGWLQIVNSTIQGNDAQRYGGGVSNNNGQATIQASQFLSNTAVIRGGAIENSGWLTVSYSTLNYNRAISLTAMVGRGGAINNSATAVIDNSTLAYNQSFSAGGGIWNNAITQLSRTTVANNSASSGTGTGGGIHNSIDADLTLDQSTISNNTVINSGGGLHNLGTITMTNSTVSGNHANGGGGLYNLEISLIQFSTFSENGAIQGGNLYGASETISLTHNLIVNFDGGANCFFGGSNIVSLGYNLDDDGSCNLSETGDQSDVADELIGPLANNGGPTLTHALLPGSPAIDAGSEIDCVDEDQRGNGRPFGSSCDIGAFEFGYFIYLPTVIR